MHLDIMEIDIMQGKSSLNYNNTLRRWLWLPRIGQFTSARTKVILVMILAFCCVQSKLHFVCTVITFTND